MLLCSLAYSYDGCIVIGTLQLFYDSLFVTDLNCCITHTHIFFLLLHDANSFFGARLSFCRKFSANVAVIPFLCHCMLLILPRLLLSFFSCSWLLSVVSWVCNSYCERCQHSIKMIVKEIAAAISSCSYYINRIINK